MLHTKICQILSNLTKFVHVYVVLCLDGLIINLNQLLQLCTARTVFSILVTVLLYIVMQEVRRWLTNEKPRTTDIRLTDQ